jgi:hypothetical protein
MKVTVYNIQLDAYQEVDVAVYRRQLESLELTPDEVDAKVQVKLQKTREDMIRAGVSPEVATSIKE